MTAADLRRLEELLAELVLTLKEKGAPAQFRSRCVDAFVAIEWLEKR